MSYRPICLVRAPVETRSGYGEMSKDIVRHLIDLDLYDVKIDSINWGNTPMNSLDELTPKDKMILDRIVSPEDIKTKPDLYISISIPSEFRPIGRYNIGITAGIETTLASPQWIEHCNVMDLILTISEHSKGVLINSKYEKRDEHGNPLGNVSLQKPIEVLHNCIDTFVFKKTSNYELQPDILHTFESIDPAFNFLFVGHWLPGNLGEDRKNVGLLVKIFFEVFKRTQFVKKPGLVLKTSAGGFSLLDREKIKDRINSIKKSIELKDGEELPPVYIIHGDLTDKEMNSLYNHDKVKCHITLTHGEGFGRPLLEASISGKPVIAPGWSGHMDFLNSTDCILIGGKLEQVPSSVVWENIIIPESSWMNVNIDMAASAMAEVYNNYKPWKTKANKLAKENRSKFSYPAIRKQFGDILKKYVPEFTEPPKVVPLKLPKLTKVSDPSPTKLKLPELKKVKLEK